MLVIDYRKLYFDFILHDREFVNHRIFINDPAIIEELESGFVCFRQFPQQFTMAYVLGNSNHRSHRLLKNLSQINVLSFKGIPTKISIRILMH